jgi:hypothetical protein
MGYVERQQGNVIFAKAILESPSAGVFGSSGANNSNFGLSGNIYRAVFAAATQNPGATGADNVLAVYSIPAGSFDVAGRILQITAQGSFANNTNTKTTKLIFNPSTAVVGSTVGTGGTTIATSGAYSTTGACGWLLQATVGKYGAAGSNTQIGQETATIINTTHGGMGVPTALTATESGAILIAVTGNAATTATDIALTMFEVNACN